MQALRSAAAATVALTAFAVSVPHASAQDLSPKALQQRMVVSGMSFFTRFL